MASESASPHRASASPLPPDVAEELRRGDRHLELIFNSARDMMLLARVEPGGVLRVISVNRPYLDTVRSAGFAITAADLEGKTFAEVARVFRYDAATVAQIRERFARVIASGEPLEYEEITPTPAGPFFGRSTITPIPDAAGTCRFVLYSSQDVTDQRRAEEGLREQQRVLATLLANLPGMAYRCRNDESWTMEFVSDGCAALTGYAGGELLHNQRIAYENVIHPEDRAPVRAEVAAALARGESFDLTYRIVTADRQTKWVSERGGAVLAADGTILALEGFIFDITARKLAEQERDAGANMMRAILDHSFEFIGLLDATGRVLRANRTALQETGVRWEDVQGKFFWETPWWGDHPAEQARIRDAVQRAAAGEFVRFETTHPAAGGRILDIDFSLTPIRDASGRVTGLIPEGRDITEWKQAERARRLSEEKFALAFRASPDAISLSDLETGRLLDVNEAFTRLSGYSRAEAVNRTFEELGLWTDPGARERIDGALRSGGAVRDLQLRLRSRTGAELDFLISAESIDVGGRACLVTVGRDISERLWAEQALRESEAMFAAAFRNSPYAVTVSETESGRFLDVNPRFEELTGYSRDQVIGRSGFELGFWVVPAEREDLLRRLERDGHAAGVEITFRRSDGEVRLARTTCAPIELTGRACLLNSIEDITEQRRAEQHQAVLEAQLRQNQKLEALGTLAGGIAHDFNNILTAIMVNQELALMDLGEPELLKERLNEIGQASNRAKELVRQILTFSRQQSTQARVRQRLNSIVHEGMGLVRASLPATIEISQQLAPGAPAVMADATQVHQIVMNLCTNAAHAMRDRPGRLSVQLTSREFGPADVPPGLEPGVYAQLTVVDTGHGMDQAVLARIFEPFFTTKVPGEGTGLGLAVVHGIMNDMGGAIFVASRPGEGTTFDLYFPEAPDIEAQAVAASAVIVPGDGESILLIDDEKAVGDAVGSMLQRLGYRVQAFTDPLTAIGRFEADPAAFDLVLTDRTMPRVTGPELIERLRARVPGLPAILMSGLSTPVHAGQEPGYHRVAKPLDLGELSRSIRHALGPT